MHLPRRLRSLFPAQATRARILPKSLRARAVPNQKQRARRNSRVRLRILQSNRILERCGHELALALYNPLVVRRGDPLDNSALPSLGDRSGGVFTFNPANRKGERTRQGGGCRAQRENLGPVDSSGDARAPHLHFELTTSPKPLAGEGVPFAIHRYSVKTEKKNGRTSELIRRPSRRLGCQDQAPQITGPPISGLRACGFRRL